MSGTSGGTGPLPAERPGYHLLPGSERPPIPADQTIAACDPAQPARITLRLRRRDQVAFETTLRQLEVDPNAGGRVGPDEFADRFGADPDDLNAVAAFAQQHGLQVEEQHIARCTVELSGTISQFAQAFQVQVREYQPGGHAGFRVREGGIYLPTELKDIVVGVFGFDERPQAKPHFRLLANPSAQNVSYTPLQVAGFYQFPEGTNGAGETVGIIELGGGYQDSDLASYFQDLGISPAPQVTAVSVDGAQNAPGADPNGADGEVELDIEIVGAIAPGAAQKVFFAPNTDQGFIDAVSSAVHDPDVTLITISWGQAESGFTQQSLDAFNQVFQDAVTLGKTVFAASGDNGSTDGLNDGADHVDFPSSNPYVVGCGGTTLVANNGQIQSETVWNELSQGEGATGGGVSKVYPRPNYQADANIPPPAQSGGGRGVPDVAGNADPTTGYSILVDGQNLVTGGTSAVAPLYAALFARINQALQAKGQPRAGFVHSHLYQDASAFGDITSGNNGSFQAAPGWDATTGLGSPIGDALLNQLSSAASQSGLS